MKPVPVAESPVLISSGEEELLSWLVVVQEVTKNRRTMNKTKKRGKSVEIFRLTEYLTVSKSVFISFILFV